MGDTYLASKRFLAKTNKQKKVHQRSNESNRKYLPPNPNDKQTSVSCLNSIVPQTPKVSVLPSATVQHESLEEEEKLGLSRYDFLIQLHIRRRV